MSPFDWLTYLDIADDLMMTHSEGHFRSAVSRAYYGVFGKIRAVLETRQICFQPPNVHMEMIRWLRDQDEDKVAQIGVELDRLRRERVHADYDATREFTHSRARKSLLEARSIQRSVEVHL